MNETMETTTAETESTSGTPAGEGLAPPADPLRTPVDAPPPFAKGGCHPPISREADDGGIECEPSRSDTIFPPSPLRTPVGAPPPFAKGECRPPISREADDGGIECEPSRSDTIFPPSPLRTPVDAPAPVSDTLRRWSGEAASLAQRVPGFDLAAEAQSPEFRSLLRAGLPMERAWAAVHFDELLDGAVRAAASLTEKRVTDDLRASARRPAEAGLGALAAVTARKDVSALSRRDRADIARRAARGEKITF